MTLQEFLEKNPDAAKQAAGCKSLKEFQDLAAQIGLNFGSEKEAKEAFDALKKISNVNNNGELSDDALEGVSGGVTTFIPAEMVTEMMVGGKKIYTLDTDNLKRLETSPVELKPTGNAPKK